MSMMTHRSARYLRVIRMLLCILISAGLLVLDVGAFDQSHAQMAGWSEPANISESLGYSMYPSILTDAAGNVHVVWCETDPEVVTLCNAIYYAHFDGSNWSSPVDILVPGSSEVATTPTMAIDASGTLHLTWVGGFGDRVLYSQAYAPLAGSARSWSPPAVISSVLPSMESPDVAVDSAGVIHVVYAVRNGDGSGVFHIRSVDGGDVWTTPVAAYSNYEQDQSVWEPRLAVDPEGGLHVAWTEAGFPETFPSLGLRYARSLDGGATWSELISRPGPYSLSGILATTDSKVHHVWSGTTTDRYKFHSWSSDRGETWSNPTRTSDVGGLEGWPSLAVDVSGNVHLLQVAGAAVALTHQVWHDGNWSSAVNLVAMIPGAPTHPINANLAIGLGNQLHGVVSHYVETPVGSGNWQYDIYYLHAEVTDVPMLDPQPLTVPLSDAQPETPTPVAVAMPTRVPLATTLPDQTRDGSPPQSSDSLSVLTIGVLPAASVVVLVVIVSMTRKRRG